MTSLLFPLSVPNRSVPFLQELNNASVWDQFSGFSHFPTLLAAVSSLIWHSMGRYGSLNESLCTLSSSNYKQILEVPGEKSLWSRREEGWHRRGAVGMRTPPPPSALLRLDEALLLLSHRHHLRVGWVTRTPAELHCWPPARASLQGWAGEDMCEDRV